MVAFNLQVGCFLVQMVVAQNLVLPLERGLCLQKILGERISRSSAGLHTREGVCVLRSSGTFHARTDHVIIDRESDISVDFGVCVDVDHLKSAPHARARIMVLATTVRTPSRYLNILFWENLGNPDSLPRLCLRIMNDACSVSFVRKFITIMLGGLNLKASKGTCTIVISSKPQRAKNHRKNSHFSELKLAFETKHDPQDTKVWLKKKSKRKQGKSPEGLCFPLGKGSKAWSKNRAKRRKLRSPETRRSAEGSENSKRAQTCAIIERSINDV
ncbi:hypothetical protein CsSME_00028611 [Camellia sinensis var. sinensis]